MNVVVVVVEMWKDDMRVVLLSSDLKKTSNQKWVTFFSKCDPFFVQRKNIPMGYFDGAEVCELVGLIYLV